MNNNNKSILEQILENFNAGFLESINEDPDFDRKFFENNIYQELYLQELRNVFEKVTIQVKTDVIDRTETIQ